VLLFAFDLALEELVAKRLLVGPLVQHAIDGRASRGGC
jgi:hypothetical protein